MKRVRATVLSTWRSLCEERRAALKDPIWLISFFVILFAAWLNLLHQLYLVYGTSLYKYFVALAVLSLACFAVAFQRIIGRTWRRALLLFLWAPLVFGVSAMIYLSLGFFIKYFSGQCC